MIVLDNDLYYVVKNVFDDTIFGPFETLEEAEAKEKDVCYCEET